MNDIRVIVEENGRTLAVFIGDKVRVERIKNEIAVVLSGSEEIREPTRDELVAALEMAVIASCGSPASQDAADTLRRVKTYRLLARSNGFV
jgi:hypothetical protein